MNKKAQGAIEYLLIIGAALLVVVIVIIAMTSITTTGNDTVNDANVTSMFGDLNTLANDGLIIIPGNPCTDTCASLGKQCGNYNICGVTTYCGSCLTGQSCTNNQCVTSCTSTCTNTTRQCTGTNTYQICGDYNSDGCYEWGTNNSCTSGQTCSGGNCIVSCTNDCSTSGQRQCTGTNTYQICGNYDADSCLEWGTNTNCTSGQTCSSGNCVAPVITSTTYTPNSTGSIAWRGTDIDMNYLKFTKTNFQDTTDTVAEKNSLSTIDTSYVSQASVGGMPCTGKTLVSSCSSVTNATSCANSYETYSCQWISGPNVCTTYIPCGAYPGHQFSFKIAQNAASITRIDLNVYALTGTTTVGTQLYAWNNATSAFVALNQTGLTPTKQNLKGSITTSPANYLSADNNFLALIVYQATSGDYLQIDYADVVVTSSS